VITEWKWRTSFFFLVLMGGVEAEAGLSLLGASAM
jgi:hypothetical protein